MNEWPRVVSLLCCPVCRGPIALDRDELVCRRDGCGRAYSVRDDVPVLLPADHPTPSSRSETD